MRKLVAIAVVAAAVAASTAQAQPEAGQQHVRVYKAYGADSVRSQ